MFVLALSLMLLVGECVAAAPIWTFKSTASVRSFDVTPDGNLVVAAGDSLFGVDPATGQAVWRRSGVRWAIPEYPAGLSAALLRWPERSTDAGSSVELLDLETGATRWSASVSEAGLVRGQIHVPHRRMLLLHVPSTRYPGAFVAVDSRTGTRLWANDTLLSHAPIPAVPVGAKRGSLEASFAGQQPPIFDTDSTMILAMSPDGLVKVDLRNGQRVWTRGLGSTLAPRVCDGFSPLLLQDSIVYVPSLRRLYAVRTRDGEPVWSQPVDLPSKVVQMEMTSHGLLVRGGPNLNQDASFKPRSLWNPSLWSDLQKTYTGRPYLQLLDPATGASRMPQAQLLHHFNFSHDFRRASNFVVHGDSAFIVDMAALNVLTLSTGRYSEVAKFKLQGGEEIQTLEHVSGELLLSSSQNLVLMEAGGSTRYQSYYAPPGPSGWAFLGGTLLTVTSVALTAAVAFSTATIDFWQPSPFVYLPVDIDMAVPPVYVSPVYWERYKASRTVRDYAYVFTDIEDDERSGPGLVKIQKSTGEVVGHIVLGDRTPDFWLDMVQGKLYFKADANRIEAFAF